MLNVRRLKGVSIDAPLPVLVFNEAEAKIANIPGWVLYLTPHSAWLNPETDVVTERVDGKICTPVSRNTTYPDRQMALGTFSDGTPSFDIGRTTLTAANYSMGTMPSGELSCFFVGKISSGRTHSIFLFSQDGPRPQESRYDSLCFACGLNPSGFPTIWSEYQSSSTALTTLFRDTIHPYSSFAEKMCSIMYTWSASEGGHIYINGVEDASSIASTSDLYTVVDHPSGPMYLGRIGSQVYERITGQIASLGYLNIDLSKPENKAYFDTLNSYIASAWTLEQIEPEE